jgi:hypothetical protein
MKYIVTTKSTCIATYTVEDDNIVCVETAGDYFHAGHGTNEKFIDFQNEEIIHIKADETPSS